MAGILQDQQVPFTTFRALSLELRAFDFDIIHLPGCNNLNADALSKRPIAVIGITSPISEEKLATAQKSDSTLSVIYDLIQAKRNPPNTRKWSQFPWKQYKQLWPQLTLQQSVLCQRVISPTMNKISDNSS